MIAIDRLQQHGIKPSPQRLAILRYLLSHPIHPTVDTIFEALYPEMPTLSRTTVYNTLKLLVEKGAVKQITIDEKSQRFDADITLHAHFRCKGCDEVFDICLPEDQTVLLQFPEGFLLNGMEIYCNGYCKNCAQKRIN